MVNDKIADLGKMQSIFTQIDLNNLSWKYLMKLFDFKAREARTVTGARGGGYFTSLDIPPPTGKNIANWIAFYVGRIKWPATLLSVF